MAIPVLTAIVHVCEDTSQQFEVVDLLKAAGYTPTGAVTILSLVDNSDPGTPGKVFTKVDADTVMVNAGNAPNWNGSFSTIEVVLAGVTVQLNLQVVIDPVNDAPHGADKHIDLVDASAYTVGVGDFSFVDPVEHNNFKSVLITSLPATGELLLNGVAVHAGDQIGIADIQAGHLQYLPPANSAGQVEFGFKVQDDGGTTGCGASDTDASIHFISFTVPLANLGDQVWLDTNRNGVQDNGESGVAGVTVTLKGAGADGVFGTGDDTTATATTDGTGTYHFNNLTPGQYQVTFSNVPAGYEFTGTHLGGNTATDSDADSTGLTQVITLAAGQTDLTIDAGLVIKQATLGDRVWSDTDRDGVQDAGENGVSGVKVTLTGAGADGSFGTADDTTAATTTDANGNYLFDHLNPGQYKVQFDNLPAGYEFTAQNQGGDTATDSDANATGGTQAVTLGAGEVNLTVDAGLVLKPASLGDRVWHDTDGNGQQDAGESGVGGVTVTLLGGGADGVLGTADDTSASMVTDANGNYHFDGLVPGVAYQVVFSAPAGMAFTTRDSGPDISDSDADATGKTGVLTLAPGENNTTIDAGVYQPASIGDRVWEDSNGNGVQDNGESGIAGVTVNLRNCLTGEVLATTTTDAQGLYTFDGLKPGQYDVQFSTPNGFMITRQDAAAATDSTDSDAGASGITGCYTLASGDHVTTVDAGFYRTASLGDRLWLDANANGQQDVGETGVAGQTVQLTGAGADGVIGTADDTHASTVTDASGNYLFDGLAPGQYQVQFSAPAGLQFTTANVGSDLSDSDADVLSGKTQVVTLSSGEHNTTLDAGVYAQAAIGDRVWLDLNGNGVQDTGEAGIAGVKVNLIDANGAVVGGPQTTDADGHYLFNGLTPGAYSVRFDLASLPAGYSATARDAGSNDALDSDADVTTGQTVQTQLTSGEVDLSWDLGITAKVGIDVEKYVHGEFVEQSGGGGTEGLTPGFWKNHTGDGAAPLAGWPQTGLSPNASYETLFGVDVPGSAPTLLDALGTNGGGMAALLRHSAAALLNASDPFIDFLYTKEQVVSMVQKAFSTGDYETCKNLLATQNELEADLSTPRSATTTTVVVTSDVDADTAGSGPVISAGGTAVFTYVVKNTGTVALDHVSLTDDRIASLSFVGGDSNGNGKLDVNETWTYTSREAVTGGSADVVNVATVTGVDAVSGRTATDSDAAHYSSIKLTQSIGDRVWLDSNGNGVQDTGEAGLAGITVELKSTAGAVLQTAVTDANGNYGFDVAVGNYTVGIVAPTGYVATVKDSGSNDQTDSDIDATTLTTGTIVVTAGQQILSVDAGLVLKTAVLGDRVWYDCNNNGVQDSGETGVSGVKVTLKGAGTDGVFGTADDINASTTSDSNGLYRFDNLTAGKYQVTFGTANGYQFTSKDQGADDAKDSDADTTTGSSQVVILGAGETNLTVDAGLVLVKKSALGDRVWYDCNNNGVQDTGETGVAGVKVTLKGAGTDGVFGTADDISASTTTDSNGNYLFSNLTAGKYQVAFGAVYGYDFTGKDLGGNDAKDSDADTSTGLSQVVTLAAGETNLTVDAGLVLEKRGSIGDRVWYDCNNNGIQDTGESGVCGVKVTLKGAGADGVFGTADDSSASTTTDSYGNYRFDNLIAGKYQVTFGTISGYEFTAANQGTSDAKDSDADGTGKSHVITLAAGQTDLTVDAGLVAKACASIVGTDTIYEGNKASFTVQLSKAVSVDTKVWVSAIDGTADRTNVWAGNQKITAGGYYTESAENNKAFYGEYYDPATGLKHQKATGPSDMSWDYGVYDTSGNIVGTSAGFWVSIAAGKTSSTAFTVEAWKEAVYVDRDVFPNNSTAYKEAAWETFTLKLSNSSNASVDICDPTHDVKIGDTSTYSLYSPIVLDLDGNGVHTTALIDSKGTFDLLGTGKAVNSGWISSGDAFLAIDSNHNGRVDDISELFGGNKGDGFAKLASYDTNHDGVVNAADAHFADLLVWQDLNGDHQSDAGELRTLAQAGIASLTVAYTDQAVDQLGNVLGETSVATRTDGSHVATVDVYFNVDAADTATLPALNHLLDSTNTLLDQALGTSSTSTALPTAATASNAACYVDTSDTEVLRQIAAAMKQHEALAA
jgi:protocatechuate 3,4-dioxygenase beta subunit